jgi:hypothetical protein
VLSQNIAIGICPSKSVLLCSPFHDDLLFSSASHAGSDVTWVTALRHANWEALLPKAMIIALARRIVKAALSAILARYKRSAIPAG